LWVRVARVLVPDTADSGHDRPRTRKENDDEHGLSSTAAVVAAAPPQMLDSIGVWATAAQLADGLDYRLFADVSSRAVDRDLEGRADGAHPCVGEAAKPIG
jgi:hypothetical protein